MSKPPSKEAELAAKFAGMAPDKVRQAMRRAADMNAAIQSGNDAPPDVKLAIDKLANQVRIAGAVILEEKTGRVH